MRPKRSKHRRRLCLRRQLPVPWSRDQDKKNLMHSIRLLFLIYSLLVIVLAGSLSFLLFRVLLNFGFLPPMLQTQTGMPLTVILLLLFFALMISEFVSHTQLRPIEDLIRGMERVAEGDFTARVDEREAEGQTRELVQSFNAMAKELSGIELFRKDFINNFSHEFKTPIVSIRGFAKQLQRDDLTDEQRREYTDIIVSESERLANMSANILLLTKLENQQMVTDMEDFSLDEQLRSCVLLLEKQWTEKEIELDLDGMEEVTYCGNAEMLSHVWVNLIGNAIKFSGQGGTLGISCVRRGQTVEVTVRDTGEGMDEETQRRVFEKFYQGDSAHATEGNGLGLSLVKRITELCHGRIAVTSRKGEGTAFTVTLPDPPEAEQTIQEGKQP